MYSFQVLISIAVLFLETETLRMFYVRHEILLFFNRSNNAENTEKKELGKIAGTNMLLQKKKNKKNSLREIYITTKSMSCLYMSG